VKLLTLALLAHPGHGHTDPGSLTHYLTEPIHVIPLALAAGAAVVGTWLGRRWIARVRR
jgi:hypothetical protein